jgi:hypothetical protein
MNSVLGSLTNETLSFLYKETRRKKNQKRISFVINTLIDIAIKRIQPYMYAIMAVLVVLFLMNCFQFLYYIRLTKAFAMTQPNLFTQSNR